ncbi:MAG: rod shape-determining protein MreC [Chitinophagaceae bacterium]|nr:rod shape-determining protein MreC [Chitinophagaceae bacterium]MCU0402989.1 rod shape-determining protein MreC [Chitinophagaceae bacterium]
MRNIFLLIRRFSVLLLFLGLQILAISMLVNYSKSHRARYFELAYEATGKINKQYTSVTRYFSLGVNNRNLAAENERLNNLLSVNFAQIDTGVVAEKLPLIIDTSNLTRKYLWRMARVINNSVSAQNNYITLERGKLQGIKPDMAVVSPVGIVGIVTDVSDNMSIVMSLLHRKSNTSVAHAKTGITGILEWNGYNPERLQLKGIPKSTQLQKGDTIVTSNLSLNFPAGMVVGTIVSFEPDDEGNNYKINIRPGANFFSLEYVYIIENLFLKEQRELEQRVKK